MGVTRDIFNWLLARFQPVYESTPIRRNDVSTNAEPRLASRTLDAAGALGLLLHFLCSAMYEHTLQQLFGTTLAATSRLLKFTSHLLLDTLKNCDESKIMWPTTLEEFVRLAASVEHKYPRVRNCFGFVDGVKFPIHAPGDGLTENAYYNGWVSIHCVSCIFAFNTSGEIIFATYNFPGCVHDAMGCNERIF